MTALAIGLAVLAATASAVGTHLQHTAVRSTTADGHLRLRDLGRLVHSVRWMLGLASLATGAALLVLALGLAPLTVVPPIAVLALPIVAVLGTLGSGGRSITRATAVGIATCTIGTAGFVALAATSTTPTAVTTAAQGQAVQLAVVVMAGLVGIGVLSRPALRCAAFATAAGVGYGLVAVLVRGLTQDLTGVTGWPALAIAVTMLASGWLVQHAHASGASEVVVASVNVANPLLAATVGLALLGEADDLTTGTLVGLVLTAAVASAGVAQLARHTRPLLPASDVTPGPREPALPAPDTPPA